MLLPADYKDSNKNLHFEANIKKLKIVKKKVKFQSYLMNPIINLGQMLEEILSKHKCTSIKDHNIPGDNDSGSYENNLSYYGKELPEEQLVCCPMLRQELAFNNRHFGLLWWGVVFVV